MNYSDYITSSTNYANQAKNDYEQSLSYLIEGLDKNKQLDQEAANIRYQNLITQIEQQLPGIQRQFETNAKAAYINKQQALQQINADLSRLGVNTQGFGVTQRLLNETAYGNTYGQLVMDYGDKLQDVENQKINALGDLNADLADLDAAYAKDKLQTQQYISEQGKEVYDKEYSNFYKDLQYQDELKQQQYENEQREKEYQDQLKQQAWENAFKQQQYDDAKKQQEFENQLAQKEYELKQRQTEAQIAQANANAAAAYAQANAIKNQKNTQNQPKEDKVLTTNYCVMLGNKKAQAVYDTMLNIMIKNGNTIKQSALEQWLADNKKSGVFTDADVNKIKKQFGI